MSSPLQPLPADVACMGRHLTSPQAVGDAMALFEKQGRLRPGLSVPVAQWQVHQSCTGQVAVWHAVPLAPDGEPGPPWQLKGVTASKAPQGPITLLAAAHTYHQAVARAASEWPELAQWQPGPAVLSSCGTVWVAPLPVGNTLRHTALTQSECLIDGVTLTRLARHLAVLHRWGRNARFTLHNTYPPNPKATTFQRAILLDAFENAESLSCQWQQQQSTEMVDLQRRFLAEFAAHLPPVATSLQTALGQDDWVTLAHGDFRGGNIVLLEGSGAPSPVNAYYSGLASGWLDVGMVIGHLWLVAAKTQTPLPTAAVADTYWRVLTEQAPMLARRLESRSDCLKKTSQLAAFEVIRRILGSEPVDFITDPATQEALLDAAARRILSPRNRTEADHLAYLQL